MFKEVPGSITSVPSSLDNISCNVDEVILNEEKIDYSLPEYLRVVFNVPHLNDPTCYLVVFAAKFKIAVL
ncbi:hypothetical protein CEXT_444891 [Caerostris extrusa]|uniref:Uncharacterized protein n=1 Tax=Caerostris extrusa TaxID=172846 RepID=A0AAV4UNP1_CAEEX|nr:hypothetical protein CEXT_444891 [Caerostris extrusa]